MLRPARRGGHAAGLAVHYHWREAANAENIFATITLAAPAMTVAPLPSHAQSDYPNRMVKIVVPYPAGGVPDIAARALTTGLSGRLAQQFIVENKSGGSGSHGRLGHRGRTNRSPVAGASACVTEMTSGSRREASSRLPLA